MPPLGRGPSPHMMPAKTLMTLHRELERHVEPHVDFEMVNVRFDLLDCALTKETLELSSNELCVHSRISC